MASENDHQTGKIKPTYSAEDIKRVGEAFRAMTGEELTAEALAPLLVTPTFARPGEVNGAPEKTIPFIPESPDVAYQLIHDMLMLDGNARQNLATFVTTWMDDHADRLFRETFDKNMIDKDEYPMTADIEQRCIEIISNLWNAPGAATGTSTVGSSEAVMLGGMALKWRWKARQKAAGKPTDSPNIVMGANVQVVWEKFARYWEVEPRYVPLAPGRLHLTAEEAVKYCDENTIGVVAILGSTFDGAYEPVEDICRALDALQQEKGWDIPVHVDGASGGFVAPFIDPDLVWDFRLERVKSINSSGHKYGLVYPGVGWVMWREPEDLPSDLVFNVNYLGGNMPTFALNFSRPGSQIIGQYYNFVRLGFMGYKAIQQQCRNVALYLSDEIGKMGPFDLQSDGSELPVFFFTLKDSVTNYTVYDVSDKMREFGWQLPAYSLPADMEQMSGLRVVVRNGMGHSFAALMLRDLQRVVDYFENLAGPMPKELPHSENFHH
ncbi:MAG: glutamate decarboxylase [Candidatus Nanopelagicales bacterium]